MCETSHSCSFGELCFIYVCFTKCMEIFCCIKQSVVIFLKLIVVIVIVSSKFLKLYSERKHIECPLSYKCCSLFMTIVQFLLFKNTIPENALSHSSVLHCSCDFYR